MADHIALYAIVYACNLTLTILIAPGIPMNRRAWLGLAVATVGQIAAVCLAPYVGACN